MNDVLYALLFRHSGRHSVVDGQGWTGLQSPWTYIVYCIVGTYHLLGGSRLFLHISYYQSLGSVSTQKRISLSWIWVCRMLPSISRIVASIQNQNWQACIWTLGAESWESVDVPWEMMSVSLQGSMSMRRYDRMRCSIWRRAVLKPVDVFWYSDSACIVARAWFACLILFVTSLIQVYGLIWRIERWMSPLFGVLWCQP